jgi:DNA-binding PadR family transcriptional regulator
MSKDILKGVTERVIKDFLDLIILGQLNKSVSPMSGYDVILFIHKKFGVLVSSGTVYGLIYAMERKGLIRGIGERRKRVYKLTEKGKETVEVLLQRKKEIIGLMRRVLIPE